MNITRAMPRVAAAAFFLTFSAAACPPSTGNGPEGVVVGSSIRSHNCTSETIPSCEFTYTLTVKSNGKTRRITVDVLAYTRCMAGDRWPSCASAAGA